MTHLKNRGKVPEKIKLPSEDSLDHFVYPVFCFRHSQKGFQTDNGQKKDCASLCQKIRMWSELTWMEILKLPRDRQGHEEIRHSALKKAVPLIAKDEIILSTRFGECRLLGFKKRGVFHVLWVDYKLELYNH